MHFVYSPCDFWLEAVLNHKRRIPSAQIRLVVDMAEIFRAQSTFLQHQRESAALKAMRILADAW